MMSIFKKVIPVFIILLVSAAIFFGFNHATKNLNSFISRFCEENFDAKISIGYVGIGLALCLELKDVKIDDNISIRNVRFYPNPASIFLKKGCVVSTVKIMDPIIRLEGTKGTEFISTIFLKGEKGRLLSKNIALGFYLTKISIHNGKLIYKSDRDKTLEFVGIKGHIKSPGIYFSKDNAFKFVASGFLKNYASGVLSPLAINGRFESGDFLTARLQASNIELDTLTNICAGYLKNIITKGRIDFKSEIEVSEKNLLATCYFESKDIVLKKGAEQRIDTPIIASFILLFNFRNQVLKIKNLQGNFFEFVRGSSSS